MRTGRRRFFPRAGNRFRDARNVFQGTAALDIITGTMNPSKGRIRVPARRLSMRKLREVLSLRFELNLGYQQIGRSCAIAVSTVHKYLKRAEAAGITWPLPEDWDETRVDAMVFPRREARIADKNAARTPMDFAAIHEQL